MQNHDNDAVKAEVDGQQPDAWYNELKCLKSNDQTWLCYAKMILLSYVNNKGTESAVCRRVVDIYTCYIQGLKI